MMKRLDIRRLTAVLAVVVFGFSGPVFAQEEEPEPAAAANCASTAPVPPVDLPSCSGTVPRYGVCEIKLTSARSDGYYSNPFTDVNVTATFTSVGVTPVQTLTAYGFHDGGKIWRVRFSPKSAATGWTYTVSNGGNGDTGLQRTTSQSFTVGAASGKGFIEVDPARPYYFRFSNNQPFFGIGDTSYGMLNGISDTQRKDYIQNRSQKGFNFIRFFATGVPKKINANVSFAEGWPWKGTLASPNYTQISPQYFRRLERVLAELKACNMYAEVIVFNYYPTGPMRFAGWTTAHQALWERYVVSRLSAYDRVFLWTVTNEYDIYPSGAYEPFTAADNTWAKDRAAQFHLYDPLKHPTTVHPWESPQTYGVPPGTPPALDMGPRFASGTQIDVLSQQHWGEFAWSTAKGCLDELPGVDPRDALDHIDVAIRRDRQYSMPVINTESPYERLIVTPPYPQPANLFACADKARRTAWRIFVGGGATYANGFSGSFLGQDPFVFQSVASYFTLDTEIWGQQQVGYFANFVKNTDYRNMNPAQSLITPNTGYNAALCLAKPGSEYVVYAPAGGNVQIDLRTQTGKTFAVTRLDPRGGGTTALADVTGGGSTWKSLTSPSGSDDYVFRVKLKP